jgi:hypothetical protein
MKRKSPSARRTTTTITIVPWWVLLVSVVVLASSSIPCHHAFVVSKSCHFSPSKSNIRWPRRYFQTPPKNSNDPDDTTDYDDYDENSGNNTWTTLGTIAKIVTPWMTLLGERLVDTTTTSNQKQELEYWRVEKDDSAIALTLHRNKLVLPRPMYRPGVGTTTLDFPGGRVPNCSGSGANRPPPSPIFLLDIVRQIIQRELGISDDAMIASIAPINEHGWPVNSSFNSQKLYGFTAVLDDSLELDEDNIVRYGTNSEDIQKLLSKDLLCLQCRSILLEWLRITEEKGSS